MSTEYSLGFAVGVLAVLLIAFLVRLWQKKTNRTPHFDERQLKLRAEAYQLGFVVTIFLTLAAAFGLELGIGRFISPSLTVMIALMGGITVFAVYCIMKDAFFSVGQKSTAYMILCAVIVVLNASAIYGRIRGEGFLTDGVLGFSGGANLVNGAVFGIVLLALLIRRFTGKRTEDEE